MREFRPYGSARGAPGLPASLPQSAPGTDLETRESGLISRENLHVFCVVKACTP